jgi:hypothetical protein
LQIDLLANNLILAKIGVNYLWRYEIASAIFCRTQLAHPTGTRYFPCDCSPAFADLPLTAIPQFHRKKQSDRGSSDDSVVPGLGETAAVACDGAPAALLSSPIPWRRSL